MGKAKRRRLHNRQRYLAQLAAEDPKRFRSEWSKRLASWAGEVRQRAGIFFTPRGNPMPSAFEVVAEAGRELAACGPVALAREGVPTSLTLGTECSKAIAAAVDRKMHPVGTTLAVCENLKSESRSKSPTS